MEALQQASSYDLVVEQLFQGSPSSYSENFPADITVGQIKKIIITKYGESRGIINPNRLPDPELFALVVFGGDGFPFSPISKDDDQSLRNFLIDVGYFSSLIWKHAKPTPIKVRITLECTWSDFEKSFAKAKKCEEERGYYYEERYPENDGYFSSSSDSDSDSESDVEDIMDRERPQDGPVYDRRKLWVGGRLHVDVQVDDGTSKRRRVACIGGLGCDLKNVVKMTTTAKHVLLVFTYFTQGVLASYRAHLNKDIDNDPDDNILVLSFLTWDKFSYLLLRKLRKDVGPNVPFIALTEPHLYELDLLAFLDTPPSHVASFYGWNDDLYQDCVELKLEDVVVDIKWAGLWPSEILKLRTIVPNETPFSIDSTYYRTVCDSLKTHPQLVVNPRWLQQLEVFDVYPGYLRITGVDDMLFRKYFVDDYFPKKLANKGWI